MEKRLLMSRRSKAQQQLYYCGEGCMKLFVRKEKRTKFREGQLSTEELLQVIARFGGNNANFVWARMNMVNGALPISNGKVRRGV
jgi:hypothetical protein